jgi:hypothetical protein
MQQEASAMDHETPFEQVLRDAFQEGLGDFDLETDDVEPATLPARLRARILRRARAESGKLLAARILAGATRTGWSAADLAAEARGHEGHATRLLRGDGDPGKLPPVLLAHILRLAGIGPGVWRDLLLQTVASHAVFSVPLEGEAIFGRTHGLDPEQRAAALGESRRDPERAHRLAKRYVTEVLEEWTTLGGTPPGTTLPPRP